MDVYSHYYGASHLQELYDEAERHRRTRALVAARRRHTRARLSALVSRVTGRLAPAPAPTSVCCA